MARRNDQAAIHSSLALLQERFNQLQKTREMRQERELMRLISGARERHTAAAAASSSSSSYNNNNNSAAMHYHHHHHHHQPSMFYDSELTFQYQNRALSFFPDSRMKRPGFGEIEEGASQESESWVFGTSLGQHSSTTVKFDHDSKTTSVDVDTSLRL